MAKKDPPRGRSPQPADTARIAPTSSRKAVAADRVPGRPATGPLPGTDRIRVRATQVGYYDHARRRLGDVFDLHDQAHFSSRWMEYVDEAEPLKVTGPNEALRKRHDEILGGKVTESTAASPGILTGPEEDENPLGDD